MALCAAGGLILCPGTPEYLTAIQPVTKGTKMTEHKPSARAKEMLSSPSDLGDNATRDISAALSGLLADVFALYIKTKNFHWHVSGPHFRD